MAEEEEDIVSELEYTTRWKVLRKLAHGGMGNVYLAEQLGIEGFKKIVAVKTIRRELITKERNLNMFISEAKLVADLIHENIMQVYNLSSTPEGDVFIIMEYVKGITFSRFLKRHRELEIRLDPEMAAFICSRVCRALSYAHSKRDHDDVFLEIVHRDVTPANIMIDTLGVVKLMDFGIAKAISMGTPDEKKVLMGKYPYMSPEQVKLEGTDGRSDIFSLGIVFYEALTGLKLFPAKSREELLELLEVSDIVSPSDIHDDIPESLSEIVMSMLQMDVSKRMKSARHAVLALEKYMYNKGYGPTNEKLAVYMSNLFKRQSV
ncbi:MAG: serine/threonine protein kinase [Planctomycetes bacterium]|nr:serine/threonine protein kinase [Planctomycetota bacterium]